MLAYNYITKTEYLETYNMPDAKTPLTDKEFNYFITLASQEINNITGGMLGLYLDIKEAYTNDGGKTYTNLERQDIVKFCTAMMTKHLTDTNAMYLRGSGSISQPNMSTSQTNPDEPDYIPPIILRELENIGFFTRTISFDLEQVYNDTPDNQTLSNMANKQLSNLDETGEKHFVKPNDPKLEQIEINKINIETIDTELSEVNALAEQNEDKINTLYGSDGTFIKTFIEGKIKNVDVFPNADFGTKDCYSAFSTDNSDVFNAKFPITNDTNKTFSIKKHEPTEGGLNRPKIKISFGLHWTGRPSVIGRDEVEFIFRLKNADGYILDANNNQIKLTETFHQKPYSVEHNIDHEFELLNQTYTGCFWELTFNITGESLSKTEPIEHFYTDLNCVEYTGSYFTIESYKNAVKSTKIDGFDKVIIDSNDIKYSVEEKIKDVEKDINDGLIAANERITNIETVNNGLNVIINTDETVPFSFYDGTNEDKVNQILQYGQDQDFINYIDNMNKTRAYPHQGKYYGEINTYGNNDLNGGHIDPHYFDNITNISQLNRIGMPINNNNLIGLYGRLDYSKMKYSKGDASIFTSLSIPQPVNYFSAWQMTDKNVDWELSIKYIGDLENGKIPCLNNGKFIIYVFFDIVNGNILQISNQEFDNVDNPNAVQQSLSFKTIFTSENQKKTENEYVGVMMVNTDHAMTLRIKNPFDLNDKEHWEIHKKKLSINVPAIAYDKDTEETILRDGKGNIKKVSEIGSGGGSGGSNYGVLVEFDILENYEELGTINDVTDSLPISKLFNLTNLDNVKIKNKDNIFNFTTSLLTFQKKHYEKTYKINIFLRQKSPRLNTESNCSITLQKTIEASDGELIKHSKDDEYMNMNDNTSPKVLSDNIINRSIYFTPKEYKYKLHFSFKSSGGNYSSKATLWTALFSVEGEIV